MIISTKSWKEIETYCKAVSSGTWVIWDVDGTLIYADDIVFASPEEIYCDYFKQAKLHELQGGKNREKQDKFQDLWYQLRISLPTYLMDKRVPDTIHELQQRNITTFALTCLLAQTKYRNCTDWREQQLRAYGIDFSQAFPGTSLMKFEDIPLNGEEIVGSPELLHGIFYTHHCDKGKCLQSLLKQWPYKPKSILFVDDVLQNLQSVEKVAQTWDIAFVGIFYQKNQDFSKSSDAHFIERWERFKMTGIWERISVVLQKS